MTKPTLSEQDLREIAREAVFLVEVSRHDIAFKVDTGRDALIGAFDGRLMGQAIGNLVKNATEAIDGRTEAGDSEPGKVLVRASRLDGTIVIEVIDNGKGFPETDRQRLLEPYMTTREKGTGLGLAIVRKIVEDHGGHLDLADAPPDSGYGHGAMVRVTFPPGSLANPQPDTEPEPAKVS